MSLDPEEMAEQRLPSRTSCAPSLHSTPTRMHTRACALPATCRAVCALLGVGTRVCDSFRRVLVCAGCKLHARGCMHGVGRETFNPACMLAFRVVETACTQVSVQLWGKFSPPKVGMQRRKLMLIAPSAGPQEHLKTTVASYMHACVLDGGPIPDTGEGGSGLLPLHSSVHLLHSLYTEGKSVCFFSRRLRRSRAF